MSVRRSARQFLDPLDREGIEEVRLRRTGSGEPLLSLRKPDLPAFNPPELPRASDPSLETVTEQLLTIVTVSLQADYKWRFSAGGPPFFASVEDEDFLRSVQAGETFFRSGDLLRCRLRIRQWSEPTGLRTDFAVVKVLQHVRPAAPREQRSLFAELEEGED